MSLPSTESKTTELTTGSATSRAGFDHAEISDAASLESSGSSDYQLIIEPTRGWQFINVREMWQYRELLGILAWRTVKIRYKQTVLGAAWAILQPAMMMVVFTIFFGRIAKVETGDIPYPLFVLCGLLPWTFFSSAMSSAAQSVVGSERLITKIYFPRLIIPYAAVIASAIDFVIALILLFGTMLYFGIIPGMSMFVLPLVFITLLLSALGLGTGLSALNVSYRDFRHIVPFFVQIWMFATPAIYLVTNTAEQGWMRTIIEMNPLNALIETFRAAVLNKPIPWSAFTASALISCIAFVVGSLYFRKVEDGFADVI